MHIVLTCNSASDMDAYRSQPALAAKLDQILEINQFLFERFMSPEARLKADSVATRTIGPSLNSENDTIRGGRLSNYNPASVEEAVGIRFAFDEDLQMSRVYRMARHEGCDQSFISVAVRTTSWSIFSGLTLDSVTPSIISVFSLPLYPNDIANSSCYVFGSANESQPPNPLSSRPTSYLWPEIGGYQPIASRHMNNDTHVIASALTHPDRDFNEKTVLHSDASIGPTAKRFIARKPLPLDDISTTTTRPDSLVLGAGHAADMLGAGTAAVVSLSSLQVEPLQPSIPSASSTTLCSDHTPLGDADWPVLTNLPSVQSNDPQLHAQELVSCKDASEPEFDLAPSMVPSLPPNLAAESSVSHMTQNDGWSSTSSPALGASVTSTERIDACPTNFEALRYLEGNIDRCLESPINELNSLKDHPASPRHHIESPGNHPVVQSDDANLPNTAPGSHKSEIDSESLVDTDSDADEVVYPCKVCGKFLEEGKAFELGKSNSYMQPVVANRIRSLQSMAYRLLPM